MNPQGSVVSPLKAMPHFRTGSANSYRAFNLWTGLLVPLLAGNVAFCAGTGRVCQLVLLLERLATLRTSGPSMGLIPSESSSISAGDVSREHVSGCVGSGVVALPRLVSSSIICFNCSLDKCSWLMKATKRLLIFSTVLCYVVARSCDGGDPACSNAYKFTDYRCAITWV